MNRIERRQIESIKKEIASMGETWKVRSFIEGLGVEIINGYAYIGPFHIDLRFDNLKPQIKKVGK